MYDWGFIASAYETTFLTQAIGLSDPPNWPAVGRPGARHVYACNEPVFDAQVGGFNFFVEN